MSLPERLGESRTPEIMAYARWPIVGSVSAALVFGALAYLGPAGIVVTGGAGRQGGGMPPAPAAGAPNAPRVGATVYRTQGDSLWIDGGGFVGSGADTHDSTIMLVDTTGGDFSDPQYFGDTLGAIERDSVAADSGAVVDVIMRYKGASGGWSAPDTLTGVEMVFAAGPPSFGDNVNDVLIFADSFDYADSDAIYASAWSTNDFDDGNGVFQDNSVTDASGGTGSMRIEIPNSDGGPLIGRSADEPTASEILWTYSATADITGADIGNIKNKWHIIHHSREAQASGCSDHNSSVGRYQLSVTSFQPNGIENDDVARFLGIGEPTENCEGAVSSGPDFYAGFMWDNGSPTPHNEGAPVYSTDPDADGLPWTMLDEGWLKFTGRIVLGSDGASSYVQLWLDDTLVYDSQANSAFFQGVPDGSFAFEMTSAPPAHDAYTAWFDNVVYWYR